MYPSPAETAQRQTASTAFPQSSGAAPRPFLRTAACVGESSDEARFPRLQAHQRRRDTIPKPLPSSTRPLSALGLHRTAFSVLRYSFGNVSGIRLLAPRKRCRAPSALRPYLGRTDRTTSSARLNRRAEALFRQPAARPPLRFPVSSQQKSPTRLTRKTATPRRA